MKRLIIDCDPGFDDAQAIMMALRNPKIKVEAITTVAGNVDVDKTTANALKILDALNAPLIPVYKGSRTGLVEPTKDAAFVHGSDGLGDCGISESKRKIETEPAALALIRLAKENPGELTLVAIGPLTNLALALRLEPDIHKLYKELIIMGGAYLAQGNTENLPAEFNLFADPDGAYVVFDNWPDFTMVSWEATVDHGIPFDTYIPLFELNTQASTFIEKITKNSHEIIKNVFGSDSSFAADPLAMAVAIDPDIILESEKRYIEIERYGRISRGMTVVDWYAQSGKTPNVNIIRKIDMDRFFEMYRLAFI